MGVDSQTISLTPLPMFHIGGIGWAYLGLVNGATTILVRDFDAAEVLDLLERERVTNPVFVPTILQMLAAVPGAAERDYSSLRAIVYGASPITTPVLRAALRTFRCPLFGVYGLTETTGGVIQLVLRTTTPTASVSTSCAPRDTRCRGSRCASSTRSAALIAMRERSARSGCGLRT